MNLNPINYYNLIITPDRNPTSARKNIGNNIRFQKQNIYHNSGQIWQPDCISKVGYYKQKSPKILEKKKTTKPIIWEALMFGGNQN
jgi:hypothetical protein